MVLAVPACPDHARRWWLLLFGCKDSCCREQVAVCNAPHCRHVMQMDVMSFKGSSLVKTECGQSRKYLWGATCCAQQWEVCQQCSQCWAGGTRVDSGGNFGFCLGAAGGGAGRVEPLLWPEGQAVTSTLGWWHLLWPAAPQGGTGWRHRNGCFQGQGREIMQP